MKNSTPKFVRAAGRAFLGMLPPRTRLSLQFLRAHGYIPNLKEPRTHSERIQHRKLFEDDSLFPLYADKLRVKPVVASILGADWITPTLWSGKTLPDQPKFPLPFVVKVNHGSGWNCFVRTAADLQWDAIRAAANGWISTAWHDHLHEEWYNRIDRQILVEPLIGGADLRDYKFYAFGGKVHYIQVHTDRFTDHKCAFFDRNWVKQDFTLKYKRDERPLAPPRHLAAMIRAAETLAAPFPFVRVDLYDLPEGPRFGELTFTPESGFVRFSPATSDRQLGELWPAAHGREQSKALTSA